MAKYKIDEEGVASLYQLATDLSALNDDIDENGKKLKNSVAVLEDGLGIYKDAIVELVNSVTTAQEKGREAIGQLVVSLKKKAQDVQALISIGLG